MKYIRNDSTNPYYNLALEEYVLNSYRDDDYLLLWQNDRAIVIGKHQNTVEEVNVNQAEELGIKVVRRNTGGGAVFHDLGNLNFSLITDWNSDTLINYDSFLKPIINALLRIGIKADRVGRNDLVVEGKKVSGNAQCIHNGRILHHGTLLVQSDLTMMSKVLKVGADKISSKGLKSVRSRVANICEFSKEIINVELLKQAIIETFFEDNIVSELIINTAQKAEIEKLTKEKYETWEWNYGYNAVYSYRNAKRFANGKIELNINVKSGIIIQCKIFGDFMALISVEYLENAIVGNRTDRKEIMLALAGLDIHRFYGITQDELLECFEGIM